MEPDKLLLPPNFWCIGHNDMLAIYFCFFANFFGSFIYCCITINIVLIGRENRWGMRDVEKEAKRERAIYRDREILKEKYSFNHKH